MSFKTWKDEFYPIPASDASKEKAIEHSLQKWKGALQENLKKHNMRIGRIRDHFDELDYRGVRHAKTPAGHFDLLFDAETCSLCQVYDEDCASCPIFKNLGRICTLEYREFRDTGNPAQMIFLLEQTLSEEKDYVVSA